MIYAKIKLSPLLFDKEKEDLLFDLTTNYGEIGKRFNNNTDVLDLNSVTRILDTDKSIHNLTLTNYDNRFTSKFDRLLDEQEFLRSLDLLAFTLIIDNIPKHTKIPGLKLFNDLIKVRDNETDNEKRHNLEQHAILVLGQDFFSRISNKEIPFLEDNNAKEIIDMLKHKYKPGYLAEHNKFELANNPLYSIESQIKSGYIYDTTNEKRIADKVTDKALALHASRPGKSRELPHALIRYDASEVFKISTQSISEILSELSYKEPYFYKIDKTTHEIKKYNHLENTLKLNDDLIYNQPEMKDLLIAFYDRSTMLFNQKIQSTNQKYKIVKAPTIKQTINKVNNESLTDYN